MVITWSDRTVLALKGLIFCSLFREHTPLSPRESSFHSWFQPVCLRATTSWKQSRSAVVALPTVTRTQKLPRKPAECVCCVFVSVPECVNIHLTAREHPVNSASRALKLHFRSETHVTWHAQTHTDKYYTQKSVFTETQRSCYTDFKKTPHYTGFTCWPNKYGFMLR